VRLRNREGVAVDPVPFVVVAATAALVSFTVGPTYCLALGVDGPTVVGAPAAVWVGAVALAYRRFVHAATPGLRGEIPPERRLRRLVYAGLVGVALLCALALPFLVP
jgi:hypothetical protein